jgi:hypothetical protein
MDDGGGDSRLETRRISLSGQGWELALTTLLMVASVYSPAKLQDGGEVVVGSAFVHHNHCPISHTG